MGVGIRAFLGKFASSKMVCRIGTFAADAMEEVDVMSDGILFGCAVLVFLIVLVVVPLQNRGYKE